MSEIKLARLGGSALKRLPYDAEVEYLQADGEAYARIGDSTGTYLDIEISYESYPSSGGILQSAICGYYSSSLSSNLVANNAGRIGTGSAAGISFYVGASQSVAGDIIRLSLGPDPSKIYVNGDLVKEATARRAVPNKFIFALNSSTTSETVTRITQATYGARVHSLKRIDADWNIVMDIIPVRKGSVGYFYDRISGTLFGNIGGGAFILGKDKRVINNFDAQLEYIESTGTQCFNIGTIPTFVTSMSLGFMPLAFQSGEYNGWGYFGVAKTASQASISCYTDKNINLFFINESGVIKGFYSSSGYIGKKCDVGMNIDGTVRINSATNTIPFSFTNATRAPFYLCSIQAASSNKMLPMRIYGATFYMNETPYMDLIPVSKGGIGCLYDRISRRIILPEGTGDVICGPSI